jgi:hypothetical protein
MAGGYVIEMAKSYLRVSWKLIPFRRGVNGGAGRRR